MQYNTSEEPLKLPQYGRNVLQMVAQAQHIADRRARQAYAEHIISIMGLLNPQLCASQEHQKTLWNHLAYMSNYQLDVDYPCQLEVRNKDNHPHKLSYPGHRIHYRHYGHLVEQAICQLRDLPLQSPERGQLILQIALRMKLYLEEWKGGGIDNDKVGRDLEEYTEGFVRTEEVVAQLEGYENRPRRHTAPRYNNRRQRR